MRVALGRGGRFGRARRLGSGRSVAAAIGADGSAAVAWTNRDGALMVALRRRGGRFLAPRRLARYGTEPRVAVGPAGAVAVTWIDVRRRETRAQAAYGTTLGLGRPVRLDTANAIENVEVAYDRAGDLAIAWAAQARAGFGPEWAVKLVHVPPGGSPSPARSIAAGYAYGLRLARGADSATALSWIGNPGPAESAAQDPAQTALAPAGAELDGPVSPNPSEDDTIEARVALLGDGRLLALYSRAEGLGAAVRRAGGAFGTATALSRTLPTDLKLLTLGDGGALVQWTDRRRHLARLLPTGRWSRLASPAQLAPLNAAAAAGTRLVFGWVDARGRVRAATRGL